jgi:hypothetical protein
MPGSKSDYLENKLLDLVLGAVALSAPATLYVGLFTVSPSDAGGGTEATGGGYARVAVSNNLTNFPAAVAGVKNNATAFTFPTATLSWGVVLALGIFDAASAGNLLYWSPLAGASKNFTVVASTDTFSSTAHGLVDGQKIKTEALANLTFPTGIAASTTYFVRDSATNSFKLALTLGGTAIDISVDGSGLVYPSYDKTVDTGDTVTIPVNQLTVSED